MKVSNWGALAGALVLAAGDRRPAPCHAPRTATRCRGRSSRRPRRAHRRRRSTIWTTPTRRAEGRRADRDGDAGRPGRQGGDQGGRRHHGVRRRARPQHPAVLAARAGDAAGPAACRSVLSRGGQRVTVTVTPERALVRRTTSACACSTSRARPAIPTPARPPTPPARRAAMRSRPRCRSMFRACCASAAARRLGVTIEGLDNQLAEYFGVKEGVLVKSVQADSAAQKAGIKAGDVITGDQRPKVYDSSDVTRALDRIESNGEFTVEVVARQEDADAERKARERGTRGRARGSGRSSSRRLRPCRALTGGPTSVASWAATMVAAASRASCCSPPFFHFGRHDADAPARRRRAARRRRRSKSRPPSSSAAARSGRRRR